MLRPVDRRLLEDDRVPRQPLGERSEHVARGERLARAGRRRRRRRRERRGRRRRRAAGTRAASSRHTAAGGASTASSAGLRCASSGSSPTTAIRVPGSVRRPGTYDGLTERRRADDEHGVVRREPLAEPRPVGRQNARRRAGGPAGSRRGLRTTPGRRARRAARRASTSAAQVSGSSAPAPTTSAGDVGRREEAPRARRRPPGRPAARGARARGRGRLALLVGGLVPVVHRHDHERGAAPRRRRVERALDRGRNVLGAGGLLDADTG